MVLKSQVALKKLGPKYRTKDMNDVLGPEGQRRLRRCLLFLGAALVLFFGPCNLPIYSTSSAF